jgi:hypothetical protein
MDLRDTTKIQGLVDGIVYQQHERTDELNDRIQQRVYSTHPLKPLYDIRPVSTKYAKFPMVDRRVPPQVALTSYLDYSTTGSFASMESNGPVDGYFDNVNVESQLHNRYFALGSGSKGVYVPSSNSDLYVGHALGAGSLKDAQPFPTLFEDGVAGLSTSGPSGPPVGFQQFLNSTRMQLRGEGELR